MIVDRTKTLKSSIVSISMRMTSSCVIHLRKLSWSWQLREPGTVGAGMEDKKKNYLPEALGKNRLYAVIVQHSSSIYSVGEPIMKGKHTSRCLQTHPVTSTPLNSRRWPLFKTYFTWLLPRIWAWNQIWTQHWVWHYSLIACGFHLYTAECTADNSSTNTAVLQKSKVVSCICRC